MSIPVERDVAFGYLNTAIELKGEVISKRIASKVNDGVIYGTVFEEIAHLAAEDYLRGIGSLEYRDSLFRPGEVKSVRKAIQRSLDAETFNRLHPGNPDAFLFKRIAEDGLRLVAGCEYKGGGHSMDGLREQLKGFVTLVGLMRHRWEVLGQIRQFRPEVRRLEILSPIPYLVITTKEKGIPCISYVKHGLRGVKTLHEVRLDITRNEIRDRIGLPLLFGDQAA